MLCHPCDIVPPMWYCVTHVILCHPCDVVSPMWYCATHVMLCHPVVLCHPCDMVSPMWCCATHVILCHPCDIVPSMWYCATHEEYLLMANFGACENCSLLLRLRILQFKHEKLARGPAGTRSVGLVGSVCQITPLSFGNLLFNFSSSILFFSPFQEVK